MLDFTSPLYHYLKKYETDPTSKVFAPLAEAYRKAGFPGEAIHIAREGLKRHPEFISGKIALARALFDQKKYEEVIQELAPTVENVPDHWTAQRILGEAYEALNQTGLALKAFKMVLFFNPQDLEIAQRVQILEKNFYQSNPLVQDEIPFQIQSLETISGSFQYQKNKIRKIEVMQRWLQHIERYRLLRTLKEK